MNTNHQIHLIRTYDAMIKISDVSIDILARKNKCSLLTYLLTYFIKYS